MIQKDTVIISLEKYEELIRKVDVSEKLKSNIELERLLLLILKEISTIDFNAANNLLTKLDYSIQLCTGGDNAITSKYGDGKKILKLTCKPQ